MIEACWTYLCRRNRKWRAAGDGAFAGGFLALCANRRSVQMRRSKLLALAAGLCVFAAAGSVTSFAAWQSENGKYYYEENGNRVTNEWRKGDSDQKWRYLDSSGYMTVNDWVYDTKGTYYVDGNGIMAANQWIKITGNDTDEWYYAGDSGKIVTDDWQKINNNYYYFDENGLMQTGWVDEFKYYCDPSSGVMKTGWQQLEISDEFANDDKYEAGDLAWFYFDTQTGKKYAGKDGESVNKTIGGKSYGFNENGIMQVGWAKFKDATPEISGYKYFAEQDGNGYSYGEAVTGTWYATIGPDSKQSGDTEWFYFNASGYPKCGVDDGYQVVRINGKRYLFNDYGNPVYGVRYVETKGAEDGYEVYYFGDSKKNCSAVTGKTTIKDGDGETISCWFSEAGYGYTGVKSNYLYYKGRLQKADSGTRYVRVTVGGKEYVVNQSGQVQKNKKNLKDADGNKINISASGEITVVDGNFTEQAPQAPAKFED